MTTIVTRNTLASALTANTANSTGTTITHDEMDKNFYPLAIATNGTVEANKAIVVNATKDFTGTRNGNFSGTLTAGTFSGSGSSLSGTASALTSGVTNALKNATGVVGVAASAAPTTGQVLTATGSSTATWQNPPAAIFATAYSTIGTGTSVYLSPNGGTASTTESSASVPIPRSGTLKNLYVKCVTNSLGTGSLVITVYKNGVATALSTSMGVGVTSNADTTNTVSITAGDTISVNLNNTGTGTISIPKCGFELA